jgi:hypothetical protein
MCALVAKLIAARDLNVVAWELFVREKAKTPNKEADGFLNTKMNLP